MLNALSASAVDRTAPLGTVLMTFDGTLTSVLRAFHGEPIQADVVMAVTRSPTAEEQRLLDARDDVIGREVVLVGQNTGRGYLYATSVIAVDRLPREVVSDLMTAAPMGAVLSRHRIPTIRTELAVEVSVGPHMARRQLGMSDEASLVLRSTLLESANGPLVAMQEVFPL